MAPVSFPFPSPTVLKPGERLRDYAQHVLEGGCGLVSRTRSLHSWCTVFHARQKRTVSLMLASRLPLPSSAMVGNRFVAKPGGEMRSVVLRKAGKAGEAWGVGAGRTCVKW